MPDPTGAQYTLMCKALRFVTAQQGWDLNNVRVWADYHSIPQVHRGLQKMAIKSLPSFSSNSQAFVVVAPNCSHADLPDHCNFSTYRSRMWCRAEQICYVLLNGTSNMFVAKEDGGDVCSKFEAEWLAEALHVFEGELSCK